MPNKQSSTSIAIDPGYDRVGIALFNGSQLVHSECYTPPKGEFPERLSAIYLHLESLIREHRPETCALETLFFTKNQKTAMKVAEARGVIQLVAARAGLTITEYSPQAVKIAVTGSGSASKDAVTRMVNRLITLGTNKRHDDEYDAIALGIAHTASRGIWNNPHT
jgi:crossover junction endodeoxyribonuclease RuvC